MTINKTTESQRIRESYPDAECPDCGEPIPKDVVNGQACENCGHVYTTLSEDRNYPKDWEPRSYGYED